MTVISISYIANWFLVVFIAWRVLRFINDYLIMNTCSCEWFRGGNTLKASGGMALVWSTFTTGLNYRQFGLYVVTLEFQKLLMVADSLVPARCDDPLTLTNYLNSNFHVQPSQQLLRYYSRYYMSNC